MLGFQDAMGKGTEHPCPPGLSCLVDDEDNKQGNSNDKLRQGL